MSDIRKLLSIVTESTTAGSIATNAAVPLTSETIKRENKPSEYGNWENSLGEEKVRLDKSCWKGYKKQGTKMKGDTRVNNCVPTKKVKESLEVYPDPEDHSFDTLEHAKKYALRRASHLRDSSDTIEIWKDKQKNKFWVNHSMNWNQRQTLEKRANLVDNVSRRDVKESTLTKGQKKARQVSATEPTKSIRVLGNKPQKHPFDGKLVGVAESYRDDPNSLSSKIPSTDTIPQDSTAGQAQLQAMVDGMKQQTIDRILDINPEWGRSDLSLMTAAELNQMLRDLPLPAKRAKKDVTEMDKSQPSHGRDGKISHSTYGSRDKKGSDYFKGKEVPVKPITVKKMEKDALEILKKQGVAEAKILSDHDKQKMYRSVENGINRYAERLEDEHGRMEDWPEDVGYQAWEDARDDVEHFLSMTDGSKRVLHAILSKIENDYDGMIQAALAHNMLENGGFDDVYEGKQGVAEGQLDEIIDPTTAIAKTLRYIGRKFATVFPWLAVGGLGATLTYTGLLAPMVTAVGGAANAIAALGTEAVIGSAMAGTYAAPSLIQSIKDLFAADENSIQAGIKRWVEKHVGDENDVQEFLLIHAKAAYGGKTGFRWRAKEWTVKLNKDQAEAYLEKNDKTWLDMEKQRVLDAEKKKPEQGVAEATGDISFDQILKDITSKKAVKKQRQSDTKQQSKRSFDSMFGGGNPAVILDIRKKKVTESFSWKSLDSGLSLDNKMTIFEEYYTKGNLFESIDENEKSYFMSLFNMSSTPEKNNRYIVAPLSLVGNKIMTLAKPRYLEYLGKSKGQLVFKSDKGQIRYPSETMRDLSVSNTFTFSSVDLYNKFRTALILKFNADLPRIMGVAEGAMKDIMHADAEQLELKDFIEKYGNEDWVKEFWHNINDIGDHTLHEVTEARDPKEFISQVVDTVQADDAFNEINDLINKLGIKNLEVTTGSENIYIKDKSRAHQTLPKTEIHLTYGRDGHRFAKRSDVERAKNSIRTQYKIGAIKEESAMFEDELSEEQLKEKLKKEMNLFMKSHRSKNKELSTKPKDREIHKKV